MSRAALFTLLGVALSLGACAPPQAQTQETPAPVDDAQDFCDQDAECPPGWICLGGVCSAYECETKDSCAEGLVCQGGWCAEPPEQCGGPEDCPGALICEGFTRVCIDPFAGGCLNDLGCAAEPGCEDGCACNDGACEPLPETWVDPNDPNDPNNAQQSAQAIDLGGYVIENRENSPPVHIAVIPAATVLEPGGMLIIGRDAEREEFENAWGVTLGAEVIYLTTHAETTGVPIINSGERWALMSPSGTLIDGITITGSKNNSYHRISADDASHASSWSVLADTDATPGVSSLDASGAGLIISEWSDNHDTGMYLYEFIEILYAP